MFRQTNSLVLIGSFVFSLFFAHIAGFSQTKIDRIPGVYNVKFKSGKLQKLAQRISLEDIDVTQIRNLLSREGFKGAEKLFKRFSPGDTIAISRDFKQVRLIDLSHWYTIAISDTSDAEGFIKALSQIPGILGVSQAKIFKRHDIFPDDPRFSNQGNNQQWGLYNWATPGNDIHAPQAWEKNQGRNDVIVAVVDGGVDYNHNDLDPGNRSRVIQGHDSGDNDSNPMDDIPNGKGFDNHGTHVAGVIGAITNNNLKVAGVMWNCKILPVKVAKTNGPWYDPFGWWTVGNAFDGDIADGIDWAAANGAHIINLSLGSPGEGFWHDVRLVFGSNPITEATWNAYQQGVVVVASMGNDDDNTINYPAGYPWTIAVGATNLNDQRVTNIGWGSNTGNHIDVAAPGINYFTTFRNQADGSFSGTSNSAPIVSGIAGLILSESLDRGLNLTNDDVRHLLQISADKVNEMQGANWTTGHGFGRVNADNALTFLNAPYSVAQASVVGGTVIETWGSHAHTFYGNDGLASGVYYGVKQYKITNQVSFVPAYTETPIVWIRERQTEGWDYANPNDELPWAKITNITTTGFDVETVIYWIGSNSGGQQINAYYPATPQQATVAYTVVGKPGTPPPQPPPAPSNLVITNAGNIMQAPNLSWNASTGATSYNVYRCAGYYSSCNWQVIGTTSNTSYTDDTLQITSQSQADDLFYYYVTAVNTNGESSGSGLVSTWGTTFHKQAGDEKTLEERLLPENFTLLQNYPNPFNPETEMQYALPGEGYVELVVFDVLGRPIRRLVSENKAVGWHQIIWDGRNDQGNLVASGIYLYRITIKPSGERDAFTELKKMVLAR